MPKAQVEIMLEGIRSDFKVFGDGLKDVQQNIAIIKENILEIRGCIVDMKVELKMKADKKTVDGHEKRLVKLEKPALAC